MSDALRRIQSWDGSGRNGTMPGTDAEKLSAAQSRADTLAGLLREARICLAHSSAAMTRIRDHWRSRPAPPGECFFEVTEYPSVLCSMATTETLARIDAALSDGDGERGGGS